MILYRNGEIKLSKMLPNIKTDERLVVYFFICKTNRYLEYLTEYQRLPVEDSLREDDFMWMRAQKVALEVVGEEQQRIN